MLNKLPEEKWDEVHKFESADFKVGNRQVLRIGWQFFSIAFTGHNGDNRDWANHDQPYLDHVNLLSTPGSAKPIDGDRFPELASRSDLWVTTSEADRPSIVVFNAAQAYR